MNTSHSKDRSTISVAMCTYNGARYLSEQLKSILQQNRKPNEVVICDDASRDNSIELSEDFARTAEFPVRIYRNSTNIGYASNFRQAIQLCSGELIALSDQDDIWYDHKLARMEELFEQNPTTGGIFSNGDLIDITSEKVTGDLWQSFSFNRKSQHKMFNGDAVSVLLQRNVVTGMAFAFRKSWQTYLDHMPSNWPHDSWLALMLATESRLIPCDERWVAYRVHSGQQIGVPICRADKLRLLRGGNVTDYRALSRERNLAEYEKTANQYETLIEDAQRDPLLASLPWLPLAKAKARHMRRGVTQLQRSRGQRWLSSLAHWNDYRRYSPTGMSALIRDWVL